MPELLTVNFAVEVVLADSHSVGTETGRLGRPLRELRRREADVRAAAVQRQTVVGGLRLSVGVVHLREVKERTALSVASGICQLQRTTEMCKIIPANFGEYNNQNILLSVPKLHYGATFQSAIP